MTKQGVGILDKVREIERALQGLKAELYLHLPAKQRKLIAPYKTDDIIREVRKTRKKIWDEKYIGAT